MEESVIKSKRNTEETILKCDNITIIYEEGNGRINIDDTLSTAKESEKLEKYIKDFLG